MVNTLDELVTLIQKRDRISKREAFNCVDDCSNAIFEAITRGAGYDEIADIIADYLGLEPDYMELFI